MIRLYSPATTSFSDNGIGAIFPTVCKVTEELNGEYELYMEIPISAEHFSDIGMNSLILAKPNPYADPQPFRVYRVTKPLKGIVSVYARHIAYDLSGIVVSPYTATDIGVALSGFSTHAVTPSPFTFSTVRTTAASFKVDVPSTVWSLMGGQAGSILDVYGGEYDFDKYTITLSNRRGADRGVSVRYGKNMVNLEQDTNCASCYTGVVAYWRSQNPEDDSTTVSGNLVNAQGTFDYTRIMPLDLTEKFQEAPTVAQLDAAAAAYIAANDIGVPDVSWKVEFTPPAFERQASPPSNAFIPLGADSLITSDNYTFSLYGSTENIQALERVYLGDTISVFFEKLGVNASARVVKTEYNALSDRYDSVELGRVRSNLADTIVEQGKAIAERPTRTITERIVSTLSGAMFGALGGAVRLLDTNGDGQPDELYIADNPNPLLAQKVWRFNYQGWAVSQTGYNGPFTMGASIEDGFLADFITAANLTAGIIQSADGESFYVDLNNGIVHMSTQAYGGIEIDSTQGTIKVGGMTFKAGLMTEDPVPMITESAIESDVPIRIGEGRSAVYFDDIHGGLYTAGNADIGSMALAEPLEIESGGTGATTAEGARANLGIKCGIVDVTIPAGSRYGNGTLYDDGIDLSSVIILTPGHDSNGDITAHIKYKAVGSCYFEATVGIAPEGDMSIPVNWIAINGLPLG